MMPLQDNCAIYNLTKMSGGNGYMLDLMRGAMTEAGNRREIKITEADDNAFSFVPLEATLQTLLMTDELGVETWETIDMIGVTLSPTFASISLRGAPQEVH